MTQLQCPGCRKRVSLDEALIGSMVSCPGCKQKFRAGSPASRLEANATRPAAAAAPPAPKEDAGYEVVEEDGEKAVDGGGYEVVDDPPEEAPAPRKPAPAPARDAITAKQTLKSSPRKDEASSPKKTSRSVAPVKDDDEDPAETDEDLDEVEEDRPRKKKKKRKKRSRDAGSGAWLPWAIGGGVVLLFTIIAAIGGVIAGYGAEVLLYGVILAVMIPISTGILILSMIISSHLAGGIEFGEIHIVIPKAMGLLLIVNIVSLVPLGGFVALIIWVIGLMVLFHLDFWECRFLIFINWVLNFVAKLAVVGILLAVVFHAAEKGISTGSGGDGTSAKAIDKECSKLLRDDLAIEIRDWHNKTGLRAHADLADKLYEAGAKKVTVINRLNRDTAIMDPIRMVITLPSDKTARANIIAVRNAKAEKTGDEPATDEGQSYLLLDLEDHTGPFGH
ncbi:hypothetical protein AYO40_05235 [Planctomycetaceae bacterium SCGC AG-212-D15]|nr:hypothetical protein AYO40_05235 [Planctomycetaceae bacterium SCGC AG-212-D15]